MYDSHDHRAGKRLSSKPWETYTLPPNFSKGPRDPREPPSRSERVRQDIARHPDSTGAEVAKRLQLAGNQANSTLAQLVTAGKLAKGERLTDDGSRKLNTYRIAGTLTPAEPPADKPITPSQPPADEPPPPPADDALSKALARAEHLAEGGGAQCIENAERKALLLHRLAEWPAIDAEIAGALEDIAQDLERFV